MSADCRMPVLGGFIGANFNDLPVDKPVYSLVNRLSSMMLKNRCFLGEKCHYFAF